MEYFIVLKDGRTYKINVGSLTATNVNPPHDTQSIDVLEYDIEYVYRTGGGEDTKTWASNAARAIARQKGKGPTG